MMSHDLDPEITRRLSTGCPEKGKGIQCLSEGTEVTRGFRLV